MAVEEIRVKHYTLDEIKENLERLVYIQIEGNTYWLSKLDIEKVAIRRIKLRNLYGKTVRMAEMGAITPANNGFFLLEDIEYAVEFYLKETLKRLEDQKKTIEHKIQNMKKIKRITPEIKAKSTNETENGGDQLLRKEQIDLTTKLFDKDDNLIGKIEQESKSAWKVKLRGKGFHSIEKTKSAAVKEIEKFFLETEQKKRGISHGNQNH